MFKTRLISGAALLVLAFLTIRAGGYVLLGTMLFLSVVGVFELYRALGITLREPVGIAGITCAALWYAVIAAAPETYRIIYLCGVMLVFMTIYVVTFPRYHSAQVIEGYFGVIYPAVLLSCIYLTRIAEGGALSVWLIFLAAWGSDTCAYCVGKLIGKHKMTPRLSPKKSVEGAVGGVIGASLLGAAFAAAAGQPIVPYVVICFFGAILSMIGDLAASAIKRDRGIKDYGTLIPGHGGVMDRFDSVLFTAPVILFLTKLLLS